MVEHKELAVRHNEEKIGLLSITRDTQVENGRLIQLLSINDENQEPLNANDTAFPLQGSADEVLRLMDKHWKQLKHEIEDIDDQAAYYFMAKTGRERDNSWHDFEKLYMQTLSDRFLEQESLEDAVDAGKLDEKAYPLTVITQRMNALRDVATYGTIKLDRFEKNIEDLCDLIYEQNDKVDNVIDGEETGGLQLATGGEGSDWSKIDDNEDKSDAEGIDDKEAGADRDDEDEEEREPWKASLDEVSLPWENEDYDPDDERDEHVQNLMDDFTNAVVDFTNSANQLWMNATTRIIDGVPPAQDDALITDMKQQLAKSLDVYEEFKSHAQELAVSAYELKPVFEALEDPDKGFEARMQKMISMASRPAALSETIRKSLPKSHER